MACADSNLSVSIFRSSTLKAMMLALKTMMLRNSLGFVLGFVFDEPG
jgi:hypothetical protein